MYGVSPDGVTAWIIQPRCDHAAGPARRHHYTCADLDQLEVRIRAAAAAATLPAAPRRAGPWCRFCGAAVSCPTRQQMPDAVPAAVSAFFRPSPRWFAAERVGEKELSDSPVMFLLHGESNGFEPGRSSDNQATGASRPMSFYGGPAHSDQ